MLASAIWPRLARVVDGSMRSGRRRPSQRWKACSPTGIEVRAWLSWKQLPSPAGAARARSARPDASTTLPTTRLPEEVQRCSSRLGVTRMPWWVWSTTRLRSTRESLPPPSRMPLPKVAHSSGTPGRRGCGWPPPGCRRCRPGGTAAAAVEGVGDDPGPVAPPDRAHDLQIAAGVGARVAEGVVLGHHLVDDGVAGMALADVEAGVGRARGVECSNRPSTESKA